MNYIDYAYFIDLYGDVISTQEFNFASWEAFRKLEYHTTGVDGIKKLKVAFPTDEDDAEAVKRCAAKMVYIAAQISAVEKSASKGRGYAETANGLQGKVISSVSAGNESVSFSTTSNTATLIDKALNNKVVQEQLYRDTVTEYLSGVKDANGVNLLYMGVYPFSLKR